MTRKHAADDPITRIANGEPTEYYAKAFPELLDAVSASAAVLYLKARLMYNGFQKTKGFFGAGYPELADLAGCCRSHVKRLVRELLSTGWWKMVTEGGGKHSNRWTAATSPAEAAAWRAEFEASSDTCKGQDCKGDIPRLDLTTRFIDEPGVHVRPGSQMNPPRFIDEPRPKMVTLDGPTSQRSSKTQPPTGSGCASADDGVSPGIKLEADTQVQPAQDLGSTLTCVCGESGPARALRLHAMACDAYTAAYRRNQAPF